MSVHFAHKNAFTDVESPAIEKAISSYVPEVVLKRLQAGQNEWIGKTRHIFNLIFQVN